MPATKSAPSRIVVRGVSPVVEGGAFPLKRVVGEPISVAATVFADGHDRLFVVVAHKASGAASWTSVPMTSTNPGLDEWSATFLAPSVGVVRFEIRAWVDRIATWRDGCRRKLDAGVAVDSDLQVG